MVKQFLTIVPVILLLIGCSKDITSINPQEPDGGDVRVTIKMGQVGNLAKQMKSKNIELEYLFLKLYAQDKDTVHDSVTISGNGQITATQTYTDLTSNIEWTIEAQSRDQRDSIIHWGMQKFTVLPGDTVSVTLNLLPAYSMLKAHFFPIRDSVDRVELKVDNAIKADSSFPKQDRLGDTITLAYDYLHTDGNNGFIHHISLNALGDYNGAHKILYSGDTSIQVYPGANASYRITLYWVADTLPQDTTPGAATMQVVLGAIGNVDVYGELKQESVGPNQNGLPKLTKIHGTGSGIMVSGQYAVWRSGIQLMLYDGSVVKQISNNSTSPDFYLINGNKVAWQVHDGVDNEIYYYNGVSTSKLTNNSLDDRLSAISESYVVWYSHDGNDNEMFYYDGALVNQLTNNTTNEYPIGCYGTTIYWYAKDSTDNEIYCFDGVSIQQITNNTTDDQPRGMRGAELIWWNSSSYCLYAYNNSVVKEIFSNYYINYFAADSSNAYWNGNGKIWKYDGSTVIEIAASNITGGIILSEGNVAWQAYSNNSYDLYLYSGGSVKQITTDGIRKNEINLKGSKLSWTQYDGHDNEIYYYNGSAVHRVTSNNYDDGSPITVNNGVVWYGQAENGQWGMHYWDGTQTTLFLSNSWEKIAYGNSLIMSNEWIWDGGGVYLVEFN